MLRFSFSEAEFSAPRRHRGGAYDVAGRVLQDQYAADQLVRLLLREEPRAIRVAVERASDVDVLALTKGGGFREEYHQVKGRREGLARWTIDALRTEGVWREFISIAVSFAKRAPSGWELSLVFATDAELNKELLALRDAPDAFTTGSDSADVPASMRPDVRGDLLGAVAGGLMLPAEEKAVRGRAGKQFEVVLRAVGEALDKHPDWRARGVRRVDAAWPGEASEMLHVLTAEWDEAEAVRLMHAVEDAARHLDLVVRSLRLRSRLAVEDLLGAARKLPLTEDAPASPLERAVILSLVERLQLDTACAQEAYRGIRDSLSTAVLSGKEYTESVLRAVVGVPDPVPKDPPPPPAPYRVDRVASVETLLAMLSDRRGVWMTGAPRVGKTELLRQALDASGDLATTPARAVWLIPVGAPDDMSRFWLQLAGAVAEHTSNREWLAGMREAGESSPVGIRRQVLAAAAAHDFIIVLDAVDSLSDSAQVEALAFLAAAHSAGLRVVAAGRTRWGLAAGSPLVERLFASMALGGLDGGEAVRFWRSLGKEMAEDAVPMLAVLSHRVGGIPEVLQLAAAKCSPRPTAEEITRVTASLPGGGAEEIIGTIAGELFRQFTQESAIGRLLPRIAHLIHGVDEAQARAIAQVPEDPLPWSPLGWARLASSMLEAEARGRYHVPPVYREVAKLELKDREDLQRATHRAAAGVLLARAIAESNGGSTLTIHWADVRDAVGDYCFAHAWDQAAYPAYLLVRAFFKDNEPEFPDENRRSIAEDLWLALISFRLPEARAAGVRPDVHAFILCAIYELESRLFPGHAPHPMTVEAMRDVASNSGPAGERAREMVTRTLGP